MAHHEHEESNLKTGLLGMVIALIGLAVVMGAAYFMAL